MSKPETCVCCGRVIPENSHYCVICGMGIPKKQRQIDRIRNMSVEELAEVMTCIKNGWVTEIGREICKKEHLKWLESEVDTE